MSTRMGGLLFSVIKNQHSRKIPIGLQLLSTLLRLNNVFMWTYHQIGLEYQPQFTQGIFENLADGSILKEEAIRVEAPVVASLLGELEAWPREIKYIGGPTKSKRQIKLLS